MSAGGQGELPPETVTVRDAAKDAARWALVAFGLSFPIILDIRTHLGTTLMTSPEELGCTMSTEEVTRLLFGDREL